MLQWIPDFKAESQIFGGKIQYILMWYIEKYTPHPPTTHPPRYKVPRLPQGFQRSLCSSMLMVLAHKFISLNILVAFKSSLVRPVGVVWIKGYEIEFECYEYKRPEGCFHQSISFWPGRGLACQGWYEPICVGSHVMTVVRDGSYGRQGR